MDKDEKYMKMAIDLAKRAQGMTSPNPMVGAVVVKNGKVVGRGYHKICGLAHAEVNALKTAGLKARGATLYVTLEPCDHFGRTSPCTGAIVKSGIRRVVAAMKDPNRINNGRGMARLRKMGLDAEVGVLRKEAERLNRPYLKYITKGMPYVTVKAAQSLDGKIATCAGESKWITADDARRYSRRLRGMVDAVMVGINTVLKDDPLLLAAGPNVKNPVRIVVDSRLRIPANARILKDARTAPVIIATTGSAPKSRRKLLNSKGANVISVKSRNGKVCLASLFAALAALGITHVLVEGGGELISGVIEERLADRFFFFIAPKIIGGASAPTSVEGKGTRFIADVTELRITSITRFKKDIMVEAEKI